MYSFRCEVDGYVTTPHGRAPYATTFEVGRRFVERCTANGGKLYGFYDGADILRLTWRETQRPFIGNVRFVAI